MRSRGSTPRGPRYSNCNEPSSVSIATDTCHWRVGTGRSRYRPPCMVMTDKDRPVSSICPTTYSRYDCRFRSPPGAYSARNPGLSASGTSIGRGPLITSRTLGFNRAMLWASRRRPARTSGDCPCRPPSTGNAVPNDLLIVSMNTCSAVRPPGPYTARAVPLPNAIRNLSRSFIPA